MEQINRGDFHQAQPTLDKAESTNLTEKAWSLYFSGLIAIGQNEAEAGKKWFKDCYDQVKSAQLAENGENRIAGLCLKKLGWLYRKDKDYLHAWSYHNIHYQYSLRFGPPLEIHDSLVSLDVDAYFLGDLKISVSLLRESLNYAPKIAEPALREMALGASHNNLGASLASLKRFPESRSHIDESLKH